VSTTVVEAAADSGSTIPRRRLVLLRHGDSAVGERFTKGKYIRRGRIVNLSLSCRSV
jgi:hypothetical protein